MRLRVVLAIWLLISLMMLSIPLFAQPTAVIQVPSNVSYFVDGSDTNFAVYPPNGNGQPSFGVRFDGTLLFNYTAFVPRFFGFEPAENNIGYVRIQIGQEELLIPVYTKRGSIR